MKKTLYEILGVDAAASGEEIEAAYHARIDELKLATLQDPNRLRVLQQSRDILTNPNQRATYDASIRRAEPDADISDVPAERTFLQQRGTWLALVVVTALLAAWWTTHREAPVVAQARKPIPIKKAAPALSPQAASPQAAEASAVASAPVQVADTSADPVLGDWACTDAISGRNSKYSFREHGVLSVTSTEGAGEYRFELAGKTLTLADTSKTSILTAEELSARKMILNTGADGRRIVCKR
ncbi:MAG TPA: hypothetical protein VHB46_04900 [Burkholderiales bacterium]|nr:hypothetical protein [Burkholderiales bacterium]